MHLKKGLHDTAQPLTLELRGREIPGARLVYYMPRVPVYSQPVSVCFKLCILSREVTHFGGK